jgi:branched-chain amino acid transport system permease protein
MHDLLSNTILGLATASIFALAASGLVLTYTTTGIFNFAHGAIGMLGAFGYWQLHVGWGWPIPVALAGVLLVAAPLLGLVIERVIMRGLHDAPETVRIVVTVSLLIALLGMGQWAWSPKTVHRAPLLFAGYKVTIFDVNLTWHHLSAFFVAIAVAVGLRLLLYRTRLGLDMRATVDSRPLTMLHGARPDRAAAAAWAIGCALAALAGVLIGPLGGQLSHVNLTLLIVSAYAAAVIGRLRSLPMTFAGAVFLGLADSYAIGYLPTGNAYLTTFRFVIPVVVLFVVLLALPNPQLRTRSSGASREEIPMPPWRTAAFTAGGIVAAGLVLAGLLGDADALRATRIFGVALIALSLIPLTGFGGQVSLCQMSFAAIGALVMAHHGHGGDPLALLLAAVVCAVVGALVALPALRLSGLYLALATAAFAVFLDRWIFLMPAFEVGGTTIRIFEGGVIAVAPLDLPGLDTRDPQTLVAVLAAVLALGYLLVVAVRRSTFGQRLLAMKDSPAACATLGLDLTRLKLAVFALSASMAGVGGALYAGTLGSVSPERFSLFESLPLLLITVVGGIASASGAVFAGILLGGFPIAIAVWPFLENLNRILPGTMGIALGRNPNGAVRDVSAGYAVLERAPIALAGLLLSVAVAVAAALTGAITGWNLLVALVVALVVWPMVGERMVGPLHDDAQRPDPRAPAPLEWAGLTEPLTEEQLAEVDAVLGVQDRLDELSSVAAGGERA